MGYGDICPKNHDAGGTSKLFLVALSFAGLGFFCGPVMVLSLRKGSLSSTCTAANS